MRIDNRKALFGDAVPLDQVYGTVAIGQSSSGISVEDGSIKVDPFSIGSFDYAGGEVTSLPDRTRYLGVNLHTKRLHLLIRMSDMGTLFLAKVTTDANNKPTVVALPRRLPRVPIARFIRKMRTRQPVSAKMLGSSLIDGAHNTGRHIGMLFAPSDVNYGYSALPSNEDGINALASQTNFPNNAAGWNGASTGGVSVPNGADGLPGYEWSGGGRLLNDGPNTANGLYYGSVVAVRVSGNPVVKLLLKDRASDVVRATMTVPVTGRSLIQLMATTAGASTGVRHEVEVTGGRVVLNQAVAFLTSEITIANAAVGGSAAQYALALMGYSHRQAASSAWVNDSAPMLTRDILDKIGSFPNNNGTLTSSIGDADLILVGMLANGGTDRDMMHETLMRECRKRRAEVIVCSDNGQNSGSSTFDPATWGLIPDGDALGKLAEANGCGFADTAAYMHEAWERGLPVFGDSIHQSNNTPAGSSAQFVASGHEAWAECWSGLLSARSAVYYSPEPVQPRIVSSNSYPGRVDIYLPSSLTHSASGVASFLEAGPGNNNNICHWFGVPTSARSRRYPVGSILALFHQMAIRFGLIVFANSFTAELRQNAGANLVRTITHNGTGLGSRATYIELLTPLDIGAQTGPQGAGRSLHITDGEALIQAVVVHTPEYEDVTDQLKFIGTWADEAQSGYMLKVTDTQFSKVAVTTKNGAKSVRFLTSERAGGGNVDMVSDELSQGVVSLVGGAHWRNRPVGFSDYGAHTASMSLTTVGTGGGVGNRSMNILGAVAIKDR